VIGPLQPTRWILFGMALASFGADARALDPNRLPSQYVHEQWTIETGFPGGAINGIAQTADGYLWIGTDKGLVHFDGLHFRPVSFGSIVGNSNVSILQLLTDAHGTLWIRPQGADLVRRREDNFETVRPALYGITTLSKDNNGGVLVSDIGQGIFRFVEDGVQQFGPSSPPVISMAQTADGKVWVGTLGDGLFFFADGRATSANAGLPDRKINCLLPVGSNELWVGSDRGLYRGNGGGFHRVELPSFLGSVQVLSLLRDRDSNLWVGTTRGLLRINAKGISFDEEKELRGDGGINALFEDREGNLWIGGPRGLGRIRDSAFVTYSAVSDRRFEHDGPVYVDGAGRAWFAPEQGGLYILQNGQVRRVPSIPLNEVVYSIDGRSDLVWAGRQRGGVTRLQVRDDVITSRSYTQANGLAQNSVYAVYQSSDGSAWVGTLNSGVSNFRDERFTTYTTANGLASNTISSILETRDGAMWFATPMGLSSFSKGQWRTYTTIDGLPSPEVNCLLEDSSGTLWTGTSAGIAFLASNHFQAPRESPGALREQIVGIAEDKSKRFWIVTRDHVLRASRDALISTVVKEADIHEYGQGDGLESTKGVKRSRSVVSDSMGRIWFSLGSGLSVVDPSTILDNSAPALPHIEAITADDNSLNIAGSVRIPPSPKRIRFDYTGLSLASPARIRFRYFLEGFDNGWSQPIAARDAVYTNLGPGAYRFRVVASNSEGLWNGPEADLAFTVAPTYYETSSFRILCVAALLALLWASYQLRLRHLRRQFDIGLEARVNERTRIARELHDTLLQDLHGLMFQFQAARNLMVRRPEEAIRSLDEAIGDTKKALAESRNAIQGLRSESIQDGNLGGFLAATSRELASLECAGDRPPDFELIEEGERKTLSAANRNDVSRIALEILRNAYRHAHAHQIEAEIRYGEQALRLRIRDDGKGIDPETLKEGGSPGHWGLRGVRERAERIGARVDFWSEVGAGTEVQLEVPAQIAYETAPRVGSGLFRKVRNRAELAESDSNTDRR
jgi:signal transduction histidine kinase/ligand-binding sensor domain-containing protein